MYKKYFNQIILTLTALLSVQLHAAAHNNKQATSAKQNTNYTPNKSNKPIAHKAKPSPLEKEDLEKMLAINMQDYGATHPSTTLTMSNLGIVSAGLGQHQKARKCYQQCIKVFTKHYGTNYPMKKQAKCNLNTLEAKIHSTSNQKQPKAALANSPKNDAQNLNAKEVFDID